MPEPPLNAAPIPLSRLGDLQTWHLSIRCARCHRRVMPKVADPAARHGPSLPIWRLVARLRCQATTRTGARCGGKPVTLVEGREGRKDFLITREIVVLDDRLRIHH